MGRTGKSRFKSLVEPFLTDPDHFVQEEARKALASLRKISKEIVEEESVEELASKISGLYLEFDLLYDQIGEVRKELSSIVSHTKIEN